MGINYYSILQLKRYCTKDDVYKAFGKLMYQRTKNNQIQPSIVTLCEAFEVLSDSFRRALYDDYGEEGLKRGIQSGNASIDPWTYHGNALTTYSEYCALTNPISNLIIKSNGSVSISLKENRVSPDVVHLRLKLTLNEVFSGSTKLIEVNRKSMRIDDSTSEEMLVKVNVPRGLPAGATIQSMVSKVNNGLEIKTLYVFTTEDIPHKVFKRDITNLIMVKTVSLKQAFFGTKVNINTLDHKVLRVNITQVITDDYVKIIHNEGMPDVNDPTVRGDIIIKFDIVYPIYSPFADQTICEIYNSYIELLIDCVIAITLIKEPVKVVTQISLNHGNPPRISHNVLTVKDFPIPKSLAICHQGVSNVLVIIITVNVRNQQKSPKMR
ncbi:dnaJ homolog subfamily B member 1-like [Sipha flava]|uniref:DnaJ homolog subfamily B member 1-like n=1 Tax=Sipha flava TaxID=143950 RepID=A0A8B8F4S6_9HEMI|nr:dnaJ homolog subfamily B member 1-like [Sipha flava]